MSESVILLVADQPFCTKTYGKIGCNAAVGTTGPAKCHNTRATCQDPANYFAGTRKLVFSEKQEGLSKYGHVMPFIESIRVTAGAVNLGGLDASMSPLGVRESVSVAMSNQKHSDFWVDKYRRERLVGDPAHVLLPGTTGSFAQTLDSPALDLTGAMGLRAKVRANAYTNLTGAHQTIAAKAESPGGTLNQSYRLFIDFEGKLNFSLSTGGGVSIFTSTAALPAANGADIFVRSDFTISMPDGIVTFYTSSDGVTWSQLGDPVTITGANAIRAGTEPLNVGAFTVSNSPFGGRIYWVEVRNGSGDVVAKFEPEVAEPGATTFESSTGETWSMLGNASLVMAGEDSYTKSAFHNKWLARNPYYLHYQTHLYEGELGQPVVQNLLQRSTDLSHAYWTWTGALPVAANLEWWRLTDVNAADPEHLKRAEFILPNTAYTASVRVKKFTDAYNIGGADFDGTNDRMARGGALTGVAASNKGTFSCLLRLGGGDGVSQFLITTGGAATARFLVQRTSGNKIQVFGADSTLVTLLNMQTVNSYTATGEWIRITASWDLSVAGRHHLLINGVSDKSVTTFVDGNIDYVDNASGPDFGVGGNHTGTSGRLNGELAEVYFNPGVYIDLSVAANDLKFGKGNRATPLGQQGTLPTGASPAIYLHLEEFQGGATFAINRGTGGNFTITGSLDGAPAPATGPAHFGLLRMRFITTNAENYGVAFNAQTGEVAPADFWGSADAENVGVIDDEDAWVFWVRARSGQFHNQVEVQLYPASGALPFSSGNNTATVGYIDATQMQLQKGLFVGPHAETTDAISAEGMRERHYLLTKVDGPNAKTGVVTWTLKDVFSLIEQRKAVCPRPSLAELQADIAVLTDTSFTVVPAGIGAKFAASGIVVVGKEAMNFTRVGDVFTTAGRGVFGSEVETHEAEDVVQEVYQEVSQQLHNIAYRLLTNFSEIPAIFINKVQWDIDGLKIPELHTGRIASPTAVFELLGELVLQGTFTLFPNVSTGEVEFIPLRAASSARALVDSLHVIEDEVDVKRQEAKRTSQVWVYYGQINPVESTDDVKNYRSRLALIDTAAEGPQQYGSPAIKTIKSRWIPPNARSFAENLGERIMSMFRDPPVEATFLMRQEDSWQMNLARLIDLKLADVVDFFGNAANLVYGIFRMERRPRNRVLVSGQSMKFAEQDLTRRIFIEFDETDVNMRTKHDALYGPPVAGTTVKLTVNPGVFVGGGSPTSWALDTGSWPEGVTLQWEINGEILPKGGDGGQGGNVRTELLTGDPVGDPPVAPTEESCAEVFVGSNGQNGAHGARLLHPVTISGSGIIRGGFGGGGGGGAGRGDFFNFVAGGYDMWCCGSGGAGARGFPVGNPASRGVDVGTLGKHRSANNPGSPGSEPGSPTAATRTTHGTGGASGSSSEFNNRRIVGGAGGNGTASGTAATHTDTFTALEEKAGGAAGARGNAINGNSLATFSGWTGTIDGAQVG